VIPRIDNLNKAFDNRIRLAIMSVLFVREEVDFNELKDMLGVTDGNLATHVAVLERHRYLKVKKLFVGRKPRTTYTMTDTGRKAFSGHVDALEEIIRERKK
jgi:DNA-binding HxlR family transcriptional regulator